MRDKTSFALIKAVKRHSCPLLPGLRVSEPAAPCMRRKGERRSVVVHCSEPCWESPSEEKASISPDEGWGAWFYQHLITAVLAAQASGWTSVFHCWNDILLIAYLKVLATQSGVGLCWSKTAWGVRKPTRDHCTVIKTQKSSELCTPALVLSPDFYLP